MHAVRAAACCAVQAPPQSHPDTAFPVPEDEKQMIKNLTLEELESWCVDMGERCVFSSLSVAVLNVTEGLRRLVWRSCPLLAPVLGIWFELSDTLSGFAIPALP